MLRAMRAAAPPAVALALALTACAGSSGAPEPGPAQASVPAAVEPAAASPTGPGTVAVEQFHSAALGVDKQYLVWLPPGYQDSTARYPVLYMLHGLGGHETDWRDLGIAATAESIGLRAIIVMPDGDDGFYVDWPGPVDLDACLAGHRPFGSEADMHHYCVASPRYQDYIVDDLIGHIDSTYRTVADRRGRAIGGQSMGGYGAFYLAFARPDLFGAVAAHAGVASILYQGPHPYRRGAADLATDPRPWIASAGEFGVLFRRVFGEEIAGWRAHDPATLAARLHDHQLAIYFDCGTEDEFRLQDANQYLDEVLATAGITHEFHLIEGGHHNGAFWREREDDSLGFVARFFAASAAAAR